MNTTINRLVLVLLFLHVAVITVKDYAMLKTKLIELGLSEWSAFVFTVPIASAFFLLAVCEMTKWTAAAIKSRREK